MEKMGENSPDFEKLNKISMSLDFNYKYQLVAKNIEGFLILILFYFHI
jgi:hypothetical protein